VPGTSRCLVLPARRAEWSIENGAGRQRRRGPLPARPDLNNLCVLTLRSRISVALWKDSQSSKKWRRAAACGASIAARQSRNRRSAAVSGGPAAAGGHLDRAAPGASHTAALPESSRLGRRKDLRGSFLNTPRRARRAWWVVDFASASRMLRPCGGRCTVRRAGRPWLPDTTEGVAHGQGFRSFLDSSSDRRHLLTTAAGAVGQSRPLRLWWVSATSLPARGRRHVRWRLGRAAAGWGEA